MLFLGKVYHSVCSLDPIATCFLKYTPLANYSLYFLHYFLHLLDLSCQATNIIISPNFKKKLLSHIPYHLLVTLFLSFPYNSSKKMLVRFFNSSSRIFIWHMPVKTSLHHPLKLLLSSSAKSTGLPDSMTITQSSY